MKHILHFIFISAFLLVLIVGCGKGANDGIPSYIKVESVDLTTTPVQGSDHHLITTLWMESEGVDLGAHEFPKVIPALLSGERQVIMNAGVLKKGNYFDREIYPAYQPFKTTVIFTPEEEVTINPVFEYYPNVFFPLSEDFSNGNIFSGASRTDLMDTNNIEGRALVINLVSSADYLKATTSASISIPFGNRVYLEMEYKSDIDFAVGLEVLEGGSVVQSGLIDVFANSSDWYKIYYDIGPIVNSANADSYNFYIETQLLESEDKASVYIDNFKIVVI